MIDEIRKFDAKELAIPIYLNQRIVFDLLAIFEDGFSQLKTIKTSTSEAETSKHGVGASIGASNVFAFLGTSFSAERGKQAGTENKDEIAYERVHTPTSLFAKCRQSLIEHNLLRQDLSEEDFANLKAGEFVEFKATLRKNPLEDVLNWFKSFVEMILPFLKVDKPTKGQGQGSGKNHTQNEYKEALKMVEKLLEMVTSEGATEFVGEVLNSQGQRAVITCQKEFFDNGSPVGLVDGEFHVLGKVLQVARQEPESINLLRNTALGRFDSTILGQLTSAFSDLGGAGIQRMEVQTEIKGPALLVVPIAIFI